MEFPLVLLVAIIAIFAISFALKLSIPSANYSYKINTSLLSAAERSFYGVLVNMVGDSIIVFAKIRVADILTPAKGSTRSHWHKAFNRISSKHFDFVLCRNDDLNVLCVIELNDKSHFSKKRMARDEVLRDVCESAGLPLVEIAAKRAYNTTELQLLLNDYIKIEKSQ